MSWIQFKVTAFILMAMVLCGFHTALHGQALSQEQRVECDFQVREADHSGGVPDFYAKSIQVGGYTIVASKNVNDYALKEAAFLIQKMLGHRPDILKAMIESGSRMSILAYNEYTTDQPEWKWLGQEPLDPKLGLDVSPKEYWDRRARGMGGSETDPYCSCGEENLLGYAGDPYSTECILIHEFAHNIHLRGMSRVDPTFDDRLRKCYQASMDAGLWKGKYASVNHYEYFAEGVQSWLNNNRENDHDHNHVNTRAELLDYDPALAKMCREVLGDLDFEYTKPQTRLTGHMQGYDPSSAPTFSWPKNLSFSVIPNKKEIDKKLNIDRIFASDEFREKGGPSIKWSRTRLGYYRLEPAQEGAKRAGDRKEGNQNELVYYDPEAGSREVWIPASHLFPSGQEAPSTIESFELSADEQVLLAFTNSQRVWRYNTRGDYWVFNRSSHRWKKIGKEFPPSQLMFAQLSPDGTKVAFVSARSLYVQDLNDDSVRRINEEDREELIHGTSDWVYEEELDLRNGFRWSPDGESIAFWQLDTSGVRTFYLINNTDDIYSRPIPIQYPKVGQQNAAGRIGVASIRGGKTTWLNLPGDPRNHYIAQMEWNPVTQDIYLQQFNRLQNQNRIFRADPKSGNVELVHLEKDDKWLENENPFRWFNQGKETIWLSERSGWRDIDRIPLVSRKNARIEEQQGAEKPSQISNPNGPLVHRGMDVLQVLSVQEKGEAIYFDAAGATPTQRYLYQLSLKDNSVQRLTPEDQPGWHTYNVSPSGSLAVHTYSQRNRPPSSELIRLPGHQVLQTLSDNAPLAEKLSSMELPKFEFMQLSISPEVQLDAWVILPPHLDPSKKYPLLMHVYGEPHGQTVKDEWSGRQGLWHQMMAQNGFVVASVDNRGTMSPKGRAWRKSVHRQIGILAPIEQDQARARLLEKYPFADAGRVGVWGWSGGGSMSLNAILQFPKNYRAAIAVAPVPNQLLYDTIYQERYMGLPDDNAEGYRKGSPLTYASQLEGKLLIIHGTGDDNCHYQGVELLMNEFIRHNKLFRVMPYPNRSHSISESPNTTRHLYSTMTQFFEESLRDSPN